MSNSDIDSDGFESAEDDEIQEVDAQKPSNSPLKKVSESKKVPKDSNKNASSNEVADKFKALDVKNDDDESDNDWGWGDDDEDDNFNFNSKPKLEEPTKPTPAKHEVLSGSATQVLNKSESNPHQSEQSVSNQGDGNSAWSPWSGFTSLLSTASVGVASLTSHVSSVIESNIGIPNPEEFVSQQQQEKASFNADDIKEPPEIDENKQQQNEEKLLTLGNFVSNVTSISNRVISGGLDTLEGIGKKTMTILQENDAGLISKRKLLGLDNSKPVLSQVLREAKEKSEESEKSMKLTQKQSYRKQLHFETLFDDYHGLVHLEALEMLSKQASFKLQALLMPLSGIALNELQQTMNSVNELCELNELDQEDSPDQLYEATELEEKLKTAIEDFDIPMDFSDILE